ncbi:MAG: peptidylprolyl isomerase [Planctomycetia bacterium]|nr:peptidylprolyl isomerase [Planctomycetia bacterium]
MRRLLAVLAAVFAALPLYAEAPKAKEVTKEGELDVVTLETGALCKVYVPKSIKPGEQPGMVLTLHGHGGNPESMAQFGRSVAEHRGDVWVAYRGPEKVGPGYGYNAGNPEKDVVDVANYAIATYKVDPKRVVLHGFSAGGAMTCMLAPKYKTLFAGFIICAAPDIPGGRSGGDAKGVRGVIFMGTTDPNYALAPQAKKAVEKYAPNVCFWEVTGLGHDLPDAIYINDAINFIFDQTVKGDVKTLPQQPDHALAEAKGRVGPPPDYFHVYIAWKTAKAPAGVTRNKLQAKSIADGRLSKLKKGELKLEDAVKESDDAATKEKKGAIGLDEMAAYGQKLADKAKAMKAETWEMVETESGYHLVWRAKAP